MPGRVGARASRRLAAAVALILLPAFALGYFGVRALAEKESNLRTGFSATTTLVRDRLVSELTHLESQLAAAAAELVEGDTRPTMGNAAIRSLGGSRPWLARPFLLTPDGSVITAGLTARGSTTIGPSLDRTLAQPELAVALREAESAEFIEGSLDRALQTYRQALGDDPGDAARALVLMRVGRTLFKLGRFEEGIAQYRAVLALPAGTLDPHGIPYAVNALMQIVDGLGALGRVVDASQQARDLLRLVVDHPWDVGDGYDYFLARALAAATVADEALRARGVTLAESAATIRWIGTEAGPRIARELPATDGSGGGARHVVVRREGKEVVVGCLRVGDPRRGSATLILGYEIQPEYVAGSLLARVLKAVDLGPELRVEVVNGKTRQVGTTATVEPAPLALAELESVLPGWSVGLFHRDGWPIDRLVLRERSTYGTLIAGMVGILILGVTLTMRASAREAELSRLKTEFVSNVSHELKTPLALIRMFGETLESGIVVDEAKRQEFYGIIRRESERLTHLINNVLDVARIDSGTKQYTLAPGDVVAVVREAIDAYRPLFDRLGFAIEAVLPASPVLVSMDRDAVAQALVNLFQNAIKYSRDLKKVSVAVLPSDGLVRVSVTDQGVGIARSEVLRIFDQHYRVRSGPLTASPGSGLGLSIVKHAMEAHGGRVEVQSTPDRGSVFTLVLPVRGAA